jgi:hypothetical protein
VVKRNIIKKFSYIPGRQFSLSRLESAPWGRERERERDMLVQATTCFFMPCRRYSEKG